MAYLYSEWRVTDVLSTGPDVRVESDRWLINRPCGKKSEWRAADGLLIGPDVRVESSRWLLYRPWRQNGEQ